MNTILTDENFDKEITSTEKLVLVDFFAVWCEPCSMLAPILDKVAEDLKEKVVLFKVNVDNAPKISGKLGIEKIPTVVLFKNGKPVSKIVGLSSEISIKRWIEDEMLKPKIEI
jgi:thioredoxin 1